MDSESAQIPLRRFDYKLVAERMEGVLTNVDRDVQRRVNWSDQVQDADSGIWMTTISLMMRFAINSYRAVKYIAATESEDPRREKNYVLVLPGINRQLLDLLFSLVYMLDDFPGRCVDYQRAGWREVHQEYMHWYKQFGTEETWQTLLKGLLQVLAQWERRCRITEKEKSDLSLVEYWKTRTQLKDKSTKSRDYLRYLDKWIYRDTSMQAHLSFGALMKVSTMLLAEIMGGQRQEEVENRTVLQYHYQQFSRTAIVTLAIAAEIDPYFKLQRKQDIGAVARIWGVCR